MPSSGEQKAIFKIRPLNIDGEEMGTEITLVISEHHASLQGKNKVVGWSKVDDALNGNAPTMSVGGGTGKTNSGTKMASTVHWDGYHLWVGEFKFSNRLLGFAPSG